MRVIPKAAAYAAALVAAVSCVWALTLVVRGMGDVPRPQVSQAIASNPALAPPTGTAGAPTGTRAPSGPSVPPNPPVPVAVLPPAPANQVPSIAPITAPGAVLPYVPPGSPTPQPPVPPALTGTVPMPLPTSPGPQPTSTPGPPPPTSAPAPEPAPACEGLVASVLCTVLSLLGNI